MENKQHHHPIHVRKTTMCRAHARGRCRYGLDCIFAHSPEELRRMPDLTKTKLCQAWLKGACPLEDSQCRFAHGSTDKRKAELGELCSLTAAKIASQLEGSCTSLLSKNGSKGLFSSEAPMLPKSSPLSTLASCEAGDWTTTSCKGTESTMSPSESFYYSDDLTLAQSPRGTDDGSVVSLDSDGDTAVQHMCQKRADGQQTFVNFLGQPQAQPHTRDVQQMLSFGQQGHHLQTQSEAATRPDMQPQQQLRHSAMTVQHAMVAIPVMPLLFMPVVMT
mmetsp:Transcript_3317/g.7349  ORF Transcript_3317/g.7349 Transcript_3317/m.7349 type:complete len:276 (+) Transcript_3317:173-1000(+)